MDDRVVWVNRKSVWMAHHLLHQGDTVEVPLADDLAGYVALVEPVACSLQLLCARARGLFFRLNEFAQRLGAEYFVYDGGFLLAAPDSRRYKADRLGELPAGAKVGTGSLRRRCQILSRRPDLKVELQAGTPRIIAAFRRYSSASWRSGTLSLRGQSL